MGEDQLRKALAELIGTFILVFVGTSAAVSQGAYTFGFGFALIFIVYAIGHISGAHVNPAVTLALAVAGKFPTKDVLFYWAGQGIGALLGSLMALIIFGKDSGLGANSVAEGYSALDGFLIEIILTAILVFVIFAVATDARSNPAVSGLAIGGALFAIQWAGGDVSGASVNPFRSLAPAIFAGEFSDIWIYLTAPFIGAVLGGIAYEFIRGEGGLNLSAFMGSVSSMSGQISRPERRPRQQGGGQRPAGGRGGQQRPGARPAQQRQRPQDVPVEHYDDFGDEGSYELIDAAEDVPATHYADRGDVPAQRPVQRRQAQPGAGQRPAQGQRPTGGQGQGQGQPRRRPPVDPQR